jgi:Helicase conserved C-terminal domain
MVYEHLNLPINHILSDSTTTPQQQQQQQLMPNRRNLGAWIQGNFYEDTIPTFSEVLRNGPPESLHAALDVLVDKGLGDVRVAERYRTTSRIRMQNSAWVHACIEKKQQIQHHRLAIQQLVEDIMNLHQQLTTFEQTMLTTDNTPTNENGTIGTDDRADSSSSSSSSSSSVMLTVLESSAGDTVRNVRSTITLPPTVTRESSADHTFSSVPTPDIQNESSIFQVAEIEQGHDNIVSSVASRDSQDESIVFQSESEQSSVQTIDDASTDQLMMKLRIQRNEEIANVHKLISEKVNNMKQHQFSLDGLMKLLNRLRKEHTEPPMDDEEFQAITHAAESAKPIVTKAFADHARELHSQMLERYQIIDSKTDMTKPPDWYLYARMHRRKIIFHGGPTNSGKTYQALQRLKKAQKGMYLGPLRLLAAEIYERLTADGIYCNLYTGQEVRDVPFATHKAATVEMAPVVEEFDVVVIDEIQMISDDERGFAWTRALLGVRCSEIHVCGGLEAVDVVKRLADASGDEFELRTYKRFSDLKIASHSLARKPDEFGCFKHIEPGDCVVAFSRSDIFAIKREIETSTQYKCCVIYGSLPPTTRSEQARRFNDPDSGYDVLVASDAIGMGLNLNIRRIIFNSIFKNNGAKIIRLDHSSMKQISGRAGRRNSPFPNGGRFI